MIEWRQVSEFPDYEVSNRGGLRRADDHAEIRGSVDGRGYVRVTFSVHCVKTYRYIHRLVALAFLGEQPAWAELVRHLNGDRADNRLSNLAYGTHKDNRADAMRHGTAARSRPHLSPEQREAIKRAALSLNSRDLAHRFGVTQDHARYVRRQVLAA